MERDGVHGLTTLVADLADVLVSGDEPAARMWRPWVPAGPRSGTAHAALGEGLGEEEAGSALQVTWAVPMLQAGRGLASL
jgi:hypothetical protein